MKKRRTESQRKPAKRPKALHLLPEWQRERLKNTVELLDDTGSTHVHYDEHLLELSRTQWQFGDWNSLAQLDRDALQHHPYRAKLALLAAAGRLQIGKDAEARQYIRLAQDWGVSRKLLTRIITAGVHNSLGRAAAIAGEQSRALRHFHSAIATGSRGSEARLLVQARISHQYQQISPAPIANGSLATTTPPVPNCLSQQEH